MAVWHCMYMSLSLSLSPFPLLPPSPPSLPPSLPSSLPPSLSQDDTPLGSIDLKDVHQIAMATGKKGFSFDLTVS